MSAKAELLAPKDDRLAALADGGNNVAAFISCGPDRRLRHSYLRNGGEDARGLGPQLARLLEQAPERRVNVRSFRPGSEKGNPFRYGLASAKEALSIVDSLAAGGYYTIVNEQVDIRDGGVSGVVMAGIVEFAPNDVPRAVEQSGAASLPRPMAEQILRIVYGAGIELPPDDDRRYEFSVHPRRVGLRQEPMLVWEAQPADTDSLDVIPRWPNRFSEHLGDKTFGLLIADVLGSAVPHTVAVGRDVAPFEFGRDTGEPGRWTRTAPRVADPGRFTTAAAWLDPFELIAKEDPGTVIAAVLSQDAVAAHYAGAAALSQGRVVVEGVAGNGLEFMSGAVAQVELPTEVVDRVMSELARLADALGPVSIEWCWDGHQVWVMQLHVETEAATILVAGEPTEWVEFDPTDGLDVLRSLVSDARERQAGISLTQHIGLTSHVGEIIRAAGLPARFV